MLRTLSELIRQARPGTLFLALALLVSGPAGATGAAGARPLMVAANPAPRAPVGRLAAAAVTRPTVVAPSPASTAPTTPGTPSEEKSDLLSFQQWKQEKIREATQKLDEVRKEQGPAKKAADGEEGQSFQAEWNLETAQELEITDYVVIYLSQFAGSKKFEEAAARLTKAEIAMVMERYISMIQRGNKLRNTDAKAASAPRPLSGRPVQALSTTH